jgi:hypothetical protein
MWEIMHLHTVRIEMCVNKKKKWYFLEVFGGELKRH